MFSHIQPFYLLEFWKALCNLQLVWCSQGIGICTLVCHSANFGVSVAFEQQSIVRLKHVAL